MTFYFKCFIKYLNFQVKGKGSIEFGSHPWSNKSEQPQKTKILYFIFISYLKKGHFDLCSLKNLNYFSFCR